MKIINPFSAIASLPLSLLPTLVAAHPSHSHEGMSVTSHLLEVTDPYMLSFGLSIFVLSAVWLLKRI